MDIDEECMEILKRYARDVLNELTINNAEYDHAGFEMRMNMLRAVAIISLVALAA